MRTNKLKMFLVIYDTIVPARSYKKIFICIVNRLCSSRSDGKATYFLNQLIAP